MYWNFPLKKNCFTGIVEIFKASELKHGSGLIGLMSKPRKEQLKLAMYEQYENLMRNYEKKLHFGNHLCKERKSISSDDSKSESESDNEDFASADTEVEGDIKNEYASNKDKLKLIMSTSAQL